MVLCAERSVAVQVLPRSAATAPSSAAPRAEIRRLWVAKATGEICDTTDAIQNIAELEVPVQVKCERSYCRDLRV